MFHESVFSLNKNEGKQYLKLQPLTLPQLENYLREEEMKGEEQEEIQKNKETKEAPTEIQ